MKVFLLGALFSVMFSAEGGQNYKSSHWAGVYLQSNGKHELYFDPVDDEVADVDLVVKGSPRDSREGGSHFVAFTKGDKASDESQDPSDCKTSLQFKKESILVKDQCAPEAFSGLYRYKSSIPRNAQTTQGKRSN